MNRRSFNLLFEQREVFAASLGLRSLDSRIGVPKPAAW